MSSPHVFVVDDEPVIASSLAAILKLHGYSVTFFTSPLLALAAAQSAAPDMLISDVAMPGMSWIDLAVLIKFQYPNCKILLISGQAGTQDLLADSRNKGHHFELLLKPVFPTELLSRVSKAGSGLKTIA